MRPAPRGCALTSVLCCCPASSLCPTGRAAGGAGSAGPHAALLPRAAGWGEGQGAEGGLREPV